MAASIMGPIGGGFGYAVFMFFVEESDDGDVAKNHIFRMCWTCAVIIAVLYFFVIILLKGKPPIPPTKSASVVNNEPILQSMKELFKNYNFIFVTQAFALVYACLTTFSQEVSLVISPFGLDSVFLVDHIRLIIRYLVSHLLLVVLPVLLVQDSFYQRRRNIGYQT